MPTPDITPGAPCWIDLMTSDIEKAKNFYTELLGWTYQDTDEEKYGGYVMAFRDGKMVAGLMKNDGNSGYPDMWATYLRVDDAAATAEAASVNGGQVLMAPMDVPEQGTMAMISDASGAAIGIWQFGGHTGYQISAETGSPVWHELHTHKYADAVKFYQDVFGWDTSVMSDTNEFRYTTLGSGDDAKAGIMDASGFLPASVPSNWQIYFGVDDADATIEKAIALGAQVFQPAEDSPFGRIAALTDPTGAMFKLCQPLAAGTDASTFK